VTDDFSDLTPPPDRRLTATQRDRIRERLGRPDAESPRLRSWLLTAAAAAAVVAVVAGVAVALDGSGGDPDPGNPAASGPANAASSPTAACTELPGATAFAAPTGTAGAATETLGKACSANGPQPSCRAEVHEQLPRADQVAASGDVSFWSAGGRWVLCYRGPAVTTVHHPAALAGTAGPARRFAFSTDLADSATAPPATLVAGGPLGPADAQISYTFPDGHVQDAVVVDGNDGRRWWVMTYVARQGVLADPDTNWGRLAPVLVRVEHVDGTPAEQYRLDWQESGCAQANHGC
jgi:hypothetical protein